MNRLIYLSLFLYIWSCQSASSPNEATISPNSFSDEQLVDTSPPLSKSRSLTAPKCPLQGKILSTNRISVSAEKAIVCIASDATTHNQAYGDSHRKVAIYDSHSCKPRFEWTLPINKSPDFPYYLADTCSFKQKNLVIIKGFNTVHCLDIQQQRLSKPVQPIYKSNRISQDAQSGMIIHVEAWNQYLVGYAQDMGTFVLAITDSSSLSPILPYAEYSSSESSFSSVFLLPMEDNKTQVLLPQYDWNKEQFSISPIYDKPVVLQKNQIKSSAKNRFLILKSSAPDSVIGLDLITGKKKEVPKAVQPKNVKEIVAWLKETSNI